MPPFLHKENESSLILWGFFLPEQNPCAFTRQFQSQSTKDEWSDNPPPGGEQFGHNTQSSYVFSNFFVQFH